MQAVQTAPPRQRPIFALVLRLMAMVVLSTLLMLVKYTAETGVAFPEILFWRSAPTMPILLLWLAARGELGRLRTQRMPMHVRRAVLGMIGMAMTFGAPVLLPLAESTTLGFTTPIFAVILSALLLRERIGSYRWGAVALGFLGVLVIAQPGHSHMPPFGTAVGLGAGFMVALISIQIRDLGRTDEAISIVFWFSAISSAVFVLILPFFASHHSALQWGLLSVIGVLGCLVQLLLTASLRVGQVASVIVMDYSSLIWAALFGWLVWDQLPSAATWLGAPLIIAAGAIITWREHLHHRKMSLAAPSGGD